MNERWRERGWGERGGVGVEGGGGSREGKGGKRVGLGGSEFRCYWDTQRKQMGRKRRWYPMSRRVKCWRKLAAMQVVLKS